MSISSWLRSLKTSSRTACRNRPRFRPRIESLEDRRLLSAGVLDPTFGGNGMVTTNFSPPDSFDQAWDVAAYPGASAGADGKIVAVGTSVTGVLRKGTPDFDFALARYNPDGTLDASFGQAGKVTTAMGSATDYALSVELVGNKILVGGYAEGYGFALARYNDNGSLDTTFGNQGKVLTKIPGGIGLTMKVDATGNIVLAGVDGKGALALLRYTANGALDTTFGKGGITITALPESVSEMFGALDLAITPASAGPANAGTIVVVGQGRNTSSLFVARFSTAGRLDTSFNSTGVLVLPGPVGPPSVAIQNDGRIVVSYDSNADLQLLRLNMDGTFDTSFDGDGKVSTVRSATQWANSIALQPDGKIVVAGIEFDPTATVAHFLVARYLGTGQLDTTFGSGGIGVSLDGASRNTRSGEIAVQGNGKIALAGRTENGTSNSGHVPDFAVARFQGDATLLAAAVAPSPVSQTLSPADLSPLTDEAITRWQTAGVETASLQALDIRIADLGGTTLGLATGNTIWLDDNAAGWGWFIDPTPADDSEFTTPGDQGGQHRIDLLTVLEHEIGHLLGYDHSDTGLMSPTLATGLRETPLGKLGQLFATWA
jgi:uncharacterized delta-60 repeat protein